MGDNSAERSGKAGLQPGDSPKGRFLGKGFSSSVYETTCNGKRLARKCFVGVPSEIFEQEASVLEGLPEHKNLVKTCSWAVDEEECSLLVEYVEEDLPSLLQKEGDCAQPLDLPEALDIISQIAMGVECLHSKGVAHGGLKPKNIRVTHVQDGSGRNSMVVKVANHGLVRIKRNVSVQASVSERMHDIVRWKAPEQFAVLHKQVEDGDFLESDSHLESDFAADVYSFAVTCSQILDGNDPYPNLDWTSLVGKILFKKTRPSLPDQVYPQLRELLVSCWGEPANRPTFSEICERLKELKASLIPDLHEGCEANVTTPDAETNGIAKPTVSSPEKPPAPRPPSVLKKKLNVSKSLKSIVKGLRPDEAAQTGVDYLISPLRTKVFAGFEILIECASNSPDGRSAVFKATCMRPPPASPENAIATAITILKRNRKDPEYCKYAMKLMVALTSVGGAGSDRGMMEVATGLDLFISIMKEKALTKSGLLAAEAIVNILVYREVRKSARSQSGVVAAFFGFANVGDDYEPDFKRRAHAVCLKGLQRLARSEEAGFNETPETDHALEEGQRAQEIVAALLHLLRTGLGNQPELGSLVEDSLVALKDQLGEIDKVAPANHVAIRMMISKELSTLMVKKSFKAHTTVAGSMAIISMMSKLCGLYEDEKCPKDVVSAELERFKARFKIEGINELLKLLKNSDSKCQREFALIVLRDLDDKPSAAQLPFESILGFLTEDGFEVKEAAAGLLDSIIKDDPADCANKFMENERAWEATLSLLDSDLNGPGGEKIASLLLGITAANEKACVKIADHGVLGLDILVRYVRNHVNNTRKDEFEELLTATLVRFCKSGRACQKAVIQANGHVFLVTSLQDKEKKRVLREKAQGLLELLRNTETRGQVLEAGFVTAAVESIGTKFACPEIALGLALISSDPEGLDQICLESRSVSALLSLLEHCPEPEGKNAAASVIASLYFRLGHPGDSAGRRLIAERYDVLKKYLQAFFLENSEVVHIPKFLAVLASIAAGEANGRKNLHECRLAEPLINNLLTTQSDNQGHILKILVEMSAEKPSGDDRKHGTLLDNVRRSFIKDHMIADKLFTLFNHEEFFGRTECLKYALMLIRNLSLGYVSELNLGESGSIYLLLDIIKRHENPVSEVTGLAVKALERFLDNPRAGQIITSQVFGKKVVFLTGKQVFLKGGGVKTLAGILKVAASDGPNKSGDAVAYSTIILTAVAMDENTRRAACRTIFNCDIVSALKETISSCEKAKMKYQAAGLLKVLVVYGPTADVCQAMDNQGCLDALMKLRSVPHCGEIAKDVLKYVDSHNEVCRNSLKKLLNGQNPDW